MSCDEQHGTCCAAAASPNTWRRCFTAYRSLLFLFHNPPLFSRSFRFVHYVLIRNYDFENKYEAAENTPAKSLLRLKTFDSSYLPLSDCMDRHHYETIRFPRIRLKLGDQTRYGDSFWKY